MRSPVLDVAKEAVWFYHGHVVRDEAAAGDLVGLPLVLDPGYAECADDAGPIYDRNKPRRRR